MRLEFRLSMPKNTFTLNACCALLASWFIEKLVDAPFDHLFGKVKKKTTKEKNINEKTKPNNGIADLSTSTGWKKMSCGSHQLELKQLHSFLFNELFNCFIWTLFTRLKWGWTLYKISLKKRKNMLSKSVYVAISMKLIKNTNKYFSLCHRVFATAFPMAFEVIENLFVWFDIGRNWCDVVNYLAFFAEN